MKLVIQRSHAARVLVENAGENEIVGQIERGLVVFVGVTATDTDDNARKCAAKIAALRVFDDEDGRFNLNLEQVGGAVLLVSNFTLCGELKKGARPTFTSAARPDEANRLFELVATLLGDAHVPVQTGRFGAQMRVIVENEGPFTLSLEF